MSAQNLIVTRYQNNPVFTRDEMKIGPGAPPFKTNQDQQHIDYGVLETLAGAVYPLGVALYDLNDPAKIIGVSDQ